jgi:hypothetical protein
MLGQIISIGVHCTAYVAFEQPYRSAVSPGWIFGLAGFF